MKSFMGKKLDLTRIASELSQGSVFFQRSAPASKPALPSPPPPPTQQQVPNNEKQVTDRTNGRADERSNDQKTVRTEVQSDERTSVQAVESTNDPSTERPKVRNAFDVYADQIFSLRELAIRRSKREGKRVTLGELVQEAFDNFIEQNK